MDEADEFEYRRREDAALSLAAFGGGGHSLFGGAWGEQAGERDQQGPSTTHFYPNAEFQFVGSNEDVWKSQDGVFASKNPVRKNTELIEDRKARLVSYHRRRTFPFRKIYDMDEHCDTHTLLIQFCEDFDECLYYGPQEMVDQFMSEDGISISNLDELIIKMKGGYKPKPLTLTERERSKAYRSRRESTMAKIQETDDVCACQSFMVSLRLDNGASFFCGSPVMVTRFFAKGVSSSCLSTRVNIRPYEMDEQDSASCSVPFCSVTRNTLPRWRRAAIDHFEWPAALPVTLYTARTFAQRAQWAAELDMDPGQVPAKMCVCSFHFASGRLTDDDPLPSVLLKNPAPGDDGKWDTIVFGGKKIANDDAVSSNREMPANATRNSNLLDTGRYIQFVPTRKRRRIMRKKRGMKIKTKMKKLPPAHRYSRKLLAKAKRAHLKTLVTCPRCREKIGGYKCFFRHFWTAHGHVDHRKTEKPTLTMERDQDGAASVATEDDEDEDKLVIDLDASVGVKGKKIRTAKASCLGPITVSETERAAALKSLYPVNCVQTMNQKKKYVCAVCKSVCDLFGLFVHMKQVHKGILCQYCLKLFKKVGDLEMHLKKAHKIGSRYYHSSQQFETHAGRNYTFICSECNTMVDFATLDRHLCGKPILPKKKPGDETGPNLCCPFCDRTFHHSAPLEMHICSGWCRGMTFDKKPATAEDVAKVYKVLTGLELTGEVEQLVPEGSAPLKAGQKKVASQTQEPIPKFSLSHRESIAAYIGTTENEVHPVSSALPRNGNVFYPTLRIVNNHVKKEVRESGKTLDLVSLLKAAGVTALEANATSTEGRKDGSSASLSLLDNLAELEITQAGRNFILRNPRKEREAEEGRRRAQAAEEEKRRQRMLEMERQRQQQQDQAGEPKIPLLTIRTPQSTPKRSSSLVLKVPTPSSVAASDETPHGGKVMAGLGPASSSKKKKESKKQRRTRVANEIFENMLRIKDTLDMYRENCLFCQQTCFVSVDTMFLLNHFNVVHNQEEVRGILKEDPQHCIDRIKRHLKDVRVRDSIFTYDVVDEFKFSGYRKYRCCYCSGKVFEEYSDLFKHIDEEHKTHMLTCPLCSNIFLNYGSYASHVCFGPPQSQQSARAKFRCKLCRKQDLSTFLDFQVHVRRSHNACEMCFKNESDQESLYRHCQTHSLELMCMKCFLTYDNRNQFRKHLHFKHGEESKPCRQCRHRTWPHVYHFCIKQTELDCEVCDRHFDGLKPYRVHMRTHTGDKPYLCNAKGCQQAYISRQLLWKHQVRRHPELKVNAAKSLEEKRNKRLVQKFDATSMESILTAKSVIEGLIASALPEPEPESESESEDEDRSADTSLEEQQMRKAQEAEGTEDGEDNAEDNNYDPIDAAVRSIMGPEGSFDIRKSPTKSPGRHGGTILSPIHANRTPPVASTTPVRQVPPAPLPPSAANFASAMSGNIEDESEPPQLVVRSAQPGARPVAIRPQQIVGRPGPGVQMPGGIPIVRVGQVLQSPPGMIPPPQRGANVRLPVMPGVGARSSRYLGQNGGDDGDGSDDSKDNSPSPPRRTVSSMWNQDLMGIMPLSEKKAKEAEPPRKTIKTLAPRAWDVLLSESSSDSDGEDGPKGPKKAKIVERLTDKKLSIKDHDYCHAAFAAAQPTEDLSEMGKILSDVALGASEPAYKSPEEPKTKKSKKKKKKKKKKKRKHRNKDGDRDEASSSSNSDTEIDVTEDGAVANNNRGLVAKASGPKPKYHTPGASKGVTAQMARPRFSSSSEDEGENSDDEKSNSDIGSSDLDTDFEAEGLLVNLKQIQTQARRIRPTAKVVEAEETRKMKKDVDSDENANNGLSGGDSSDESGDISGERSDSDQDVKVSKYHQQRMTTGANRLVRPPPLQPQKPLKLKIRLPPKPGSSSQPSTPATPLTSSGRPRMINTSLSARSSSAKSAAAAKSRVALTPSAKTQRQQFSSSPEKRASPESDPSTGQPLSKKMRESLALNRPASDSDSDTEDSSPRLQVVTKQQVALDDSGGLGSADNKLYCVCQCPHDDVSEMIGCDAPDCRLEWFHFECVGIMVPPEGQWFCPECARRYKVRQ